MKKKIILTALAFTALNIVTVYSQQTITLSQLLGKQWINEYEMRTFPDDPVNIITTKLTYGVNGILFIEMGIKNAVRGIDWHDSVTHTYYLSDTIPAAFDESRVGKSVSGKYIVEKLGEGRLIAHEVRSLTKSGIYMYLTVRIKEENNLANNNDLQFRAITTQSVPF